MQQPSLFIPHGGGPCFFMDWDPSHIWDNMKAYLEGLATTLPARPSAIIVISGHWEEPAFTVQTTPAPTLIYDYSGFPPHTYQLKYPASGSPQLAAQVRELLQAAGLDARLDETRGYDHGVFIPLKVAFPLADIPVIQLSLHNSLDPALHYEAGRALAPLREQNVLIVGSGMSFHNMRVFMQRFSNASMPADPKAAAFDQWLTGAVTGGDTKSQLSQWQEAPAARYAHPREEHLLPLMVAAGAGQEGRKVLHDLSLGVDISAFRFD